MEILRAENLCFSYALGDKFVPTLKDVSFTIERGDFVAIRGRSGSGKSTLFYILGCLLKPSSGKVIFDGTDLSTLSSEELAFLRNQKIGFVFQQFHLLPRASVLTNILLPSLYPCELPHETAQNKDRAISLAKTMGLGDKLYKLPNQLSGGEQQRIVIARALLSDAELILADEPTGNLDSANAKIIMDQLRELNAKGKTIILITHDPEIARQCSSEIQLNDGLLVSGRQKAVAEAPNDSWKETRELFPKSLTMAAILRVFRTSIPLAIENLKRNRVRAMLTMIGVMVGIASVFAMITFGSFAKKKILEGYDDLGVRSVMIRGHKNWYRRASDRAPIPFRSFNWENDILPLKHVFPQIELLSPILGSGSNNVNYGGLTIESDVTVWGVTPEYLQIINRKVESGKGLSPYHVEGRSPVCLIGSDIVERVFHKVSPLGKILFITKDQDLAYPCRVMGVLSKQNSNKSWHKPNLDIIIPYTYFQTVNHFWDNEITEFAALLKVGSDSEKVGKAIEAYFSSKYGAAGKFNVDSDTVLISQMRRFLGLFAIMLTSIALITLGVGGMGINNMMLVSIAERLKEIGLRKAMGATDRSIRIQFLMEATLLSAVAGMAGIALGFSAYQLIIYGASEVVPQIKFEWVLNPAALGVSVVSILIVGICSGIVPALKAERLDVIEALRTE